MSKIFKYVVANVGTREKPFFQKIGVCTQTQNGPMLKLETLPVHWNGWAELRDEPPSRQSRNSGSGGGGDGFGGGGGGFDDDAPF